MRNYSIILILIVCISSCSTQSKSTPKATEQSTTEEESIEQKLLSLDFTEAKEWLQRSKPIEGFVLNEAELNAFGYQLLYNLDQPQNALKVFELILDEFPNSANAYDSAGEGYLLNGNHQKSVECYRKSIELQDGVLFHQLGYLEAKPYQPTNIPSDTTLLFQQEGNWDNETAFVYVQGGPDLQLNINAYDGLHLMPKHESLLKVYPLQAQMINPTSLASKPMLTDEQSSFENAQSVEILARVIKHLVNQDKKVFLIGHSYGSSICMEYIHAEENLADKVVLMGLDLDEDISSWETLKTGEYIRWENGDQPYARSIFGNIPEDHPSKTDFNRVADNLTMIVKSNMAKTYTELYDDKDFKKIISVYSNLDEANGRKSDEEIEFLKERGTEVVEINGDHHDMLTNEFMTDLFNHLINNQALLPTY